MASKAAQLQAYNDQQHRIVCNKWQNQNMKKIYLGSNRLNYNFKMFRVKYKNRQQLEVIKPEIILIMNGYLQKYGGKLINLADLTNCNELLVYFVTAAEVQHADWDQYLKSVLLKKYNVVTGTIELGPNTPQR